MPQDRNDGQIGNAPGMISGLARRETLADLLVRTFRGVEARRPGEGRPGAV